MIAYQYLSRVWSRLSVMRKLVLALGSMVALILFVATIGFFSLEFQEKKVADIVADSMRVQRLALEVESRLQLARQAERDFILHLHELGVTGSHAAYGEAFLDNVNDGLRNVLWLQNMAGMSEEEALQTRSMERLVELREALRQYLNTFEHLVEVAEEEGISNTFEHLVSGLDGEYLTLTSQVRQLALAASDEARNAQSAISKTSMVVKSMLIGSVLLALLLAASITWVLNRTLVKSIVRLRDTASELSYGNLEARAEFESGDEFGQLGDSINSMAERISSLVYDMEVRVDTVNDRLFEVIDAAAEGFLLYDKHGRLLLTNKKVMEMAGANAAYLNPGMSREEVLQKQAESGLFINAYGREEEWAQERLERQNTVYSVSEEPLRDGRWLQIRSYLTERGEVVLIVSDITQRKQAVQDLASMNSDLEELVRERTKVLVEKASELKKANERLRELDELKSTFLTSVSHELRTPLTSLLGFSKIIKRDFVRVFMPLVGDQKGRKIGQRIQDNLDIISNEGERLTGLINDVLDLSRIESGQDEWQYIEIDMAEAVRRAVRASSSLFEQNPQLKLSLRRFEKVPPVLCDPDRIHQVLLNLLSNAVKFTQSGSVYADVYQDARGRVCVRIEDTGKGIEKKYLERIFDKFQQAQSDTLTEKPSGTGLGLAISRQIIEQYDGRIWASSEPGKGTSMHIAMPPAVPDNMPLVLVVDDDITVREYFSMYLKKAGYGVRTAADGRECLKMVAELRPDLICMDLLMPGMGGQETIQKLKGDERFSNIPILVISSAGECRTAGGDLAMLKPVNGDTMLQVIASFLGRQTAALPALAVGTNGDCPSPVLCGEGVTHCREEEMWQMVESGYKGTIVLPESHAGDVDVQRLSSHIRLQVILIPPKAAIEPTNG